MGRKGTKMKFELNGISLELDKETVENMLKKFDVPVSRRFKPNIGDVYWTMTNREDNDDKYIVYRYDGDKFDLTNISRGNCYRSKQDAEKADEIQIKIVKLNDMIDEFNGDWVPDWAETSQRKYELVYSHSRKEPKTVSYLAYQSYPLVKHIKSDVNTLPTEIKNLFMEISEAVNEQN